MADMRPFYFRKWNHICWLYSSIGDFNKIYLNGKVVENVSISKTGDINPVIEGTKEVSDSAFIIGKLLR